MLGHRSSSPVTVHWSKDFVEHLRAVHFTLVAVSIGLILIMSRTNSPALGQIRQIIELKGEWPPEGLVPRTVTGDPKIRTIGWKDQSLTARVIRRDGRTSRVRLLLRPPNWYPVGSITRQIAFFRLVHFPAALGDFERWWNRLETEHQYPFLYPYAVYKEGSVTQRLNRSVNQMQLEPETSSVESEASASVQLEFKCTNEDWPLKECPDEKWAFSGSDFQGNLYSLPVAGVGIGSLDQSSIIESNIVRSALWKKGSFARVFRP